MKKTTTSQALRMESRDSSGRFAKNPCDCCGKPAPMEFYSDERCNTTGGFGLVLRKRCADRLAGLTDEEYLEEAKKKGA